MKTFLIFIFSSFLLLGCSQEKNETSKTSDSTKSQSKDSNKVLKKDLSDNWAKSLTNENAQDAVQRLLTKYNSSVIKWEGLIVISDFEIKGRALINKYYVTSSGSNEKMIGDFIFHKDINNYWIVDGTNFRGTDYIMASWNDPVFIRVIDK